jgi:hypothetical protein
MSEKAKNNFFKKNRKKPKKNDKNIGLFFNPETDPDHDRKLTIKQKTDRDPNRCQKVNPAGLYFLAMPNMS